MSNLLTVAESCTLLNNKKVLAYPTEAVFGLGCDPDCESAVQTILKLKQRPIEKGLILIASAYAQLVPYIDDSAISQIEKERALKSWPGPVTWIFPKNEKTPYFLTGQFDSIAVRVTDHPLVCQLCDLFGKPLVSTSANLSGEPPCRIINDVQAQFGKQFPILQGETSKRLNPSEIRDIKTGQVIRQG